MWKDSIRKIVVIFQTTILRIVGLYVRQMASDIWLKCLEVATLKLSSFKTICWQKNARFLQFNHNGDVDCSLIYHTRPIITWVCILKTHFLKFEKVFSMRFFQKILPLCMVSNQEGFVIKREVWWRAYGTCF